MKTKTKKINWKAARAEALSCITFAVVVWAPLVIYLVVGSQF